MFAWILIFVSGDLSSLATAKHPVHFVTEDGNLSPSAFIPFCEFGGNTSAMGVKIDMFDVPVCSVFQAKILNDQLCYEVDLDRFANENNIDRDLELGFSFILDYNEDRQVTLDSDIFEENHFGLASGIVESDHDHQAFIYLDTIGEFKWVR